MLTTALLPLLEGNSVNMDAVRLPLGLFSKEVIQTTQLFDIEDKELDNIFKSIDEIDEPLVFESVSQMFSEMIFILQQYLCGAMNNLQILTALKGISLFLEIDLNSCIKEAIIEK